MTNLYNGAMYIKDTDSCQGSYKDVTVTPQDAAAKRDLDWRTKRRELQRLGKLPRELSPEEWNAIDAQLILAGLMQPPTPRLAHTPRNLAIIKAHKRRTGQL